MNQLPASHAPTLIAASGPRAAYRFLEFFAANIRNPHTRRAYVRAAGEFFAWLEARGVTQLAAIEASMSRPTSSSCSARDRRRPRSCAWPRCATCSIGW